MVKDEWTEITGNPEGSAEIWDYTTQKVLEGIYEGMSTNIGPNNSTLYHVKTNKGKVSFWNTSLLNDRMQHVEIGNKIKLEYEGKVKSEKSGRSYHSFKVFTAKPV
jgi:hypothetical protein